MKSVFIMRITVLFFFMSIWGAMATSSYSQTTLLSLEVKSGTIAQVIREIEKQSEFTFVYNVDEINLNEKVSIQVRGKTITDVLDTLFNDKQWGYKITNKHVALYKKEVNTLDPKVKRIAGVVKDAYGEPIVGANVVVKGTTQGTVTDMDGNYSLEVSDNSILQISFIGYIAQEIATQNKSTLNIQLQEDTANLEEVVVVGYGVQKKKLVTGATIQVKADDLQKMNTPSAIGALQGQTPGVQIMQTSGQPGSDFKVAVRGLGTTGNAAPLYLVDGVTVGDLNFLNPSDIESIDVLKDAASAAIYGARAANGVVLVTTKQGRAGKASIEYDGYVGWQNTMKSVPTLNAQDYAMIMNEAAVNSGVGEYDFAALVPDWERIKNGQWAGTNWQAEMTNKKALTQNHALNITGGTEQSVYSLGLSYNSQDGIFGSPRQPNYERYTFRVNTEHTLLRSKGRDILKVGENLSMSYSNSSGGSDISNALRVSPFLPVWDDKTDKYHEALLWNTQETNPIGNIVYNENHVYKKKNLKGNLYLLIEPIENLKFRSSFGINENTKTHRFFGEKNHLSPYSYRNENEVTHEMENGMSWIFENTLSYSFKIKEKHDFSVLLGTSAERGGLGEKLNGTNTNSLFEDLDHAYLDNTKLIASGKTKLGSSPWGKSGLVSYFGRVNYDYKERYLFTGVIRADGSSNFKKGNRWGLFPSLSAGWLISNESFMENVREYIDFLKVRASWGQNGNQSIDNFQYLSTISFVNNGYFFGPDKSQLTPGAYPDILPNPDVTWETSEQLDLGVDARFLSGRLNFSFDYYTKTTRDWLVAAPQLGSYGTVKPTYINGGDVRNQGVELALSWNDQVGDFRYGINGNISYNKNKVLRIANAEGVIHGPDAPIGMNGELYRAEVGFPIGYFWGYKTAGVFQNEAEVKAYQNSAGELIQPDAVPGDVRFVNQDDNAVIDDNDKMMIGDPNPDVTFGLTISAEYKGLDFAMVGSGVAGNQIARSYRNYIDNPRHNYTTEIFRRWHGEGTSDRLPRVLASPHKNTQYTSDLYIEDGDYFRISNLTLGYDFKYLFKNLPLAKARLFVSVQNLCTITGYSGMDPQVGSAPSSWASGVDSGFYPTARTVMVGATIKF